MWTIPWSTTFVGGSATLTASAIDARIGGPWFWPLIVSEESNHTYWQFSSGLPLFGVPHGFGVAQVDPPPGVNDLWNWQQNLSDGLTQLNSKQAKAFQFWNRQVTESNDWNGSKSPKASGAYSNAGGPCQFQFPDVANTYDFEYAEWIKAYNGASIYYIYLVNTPPPGMAAYWVINDTPNSYVERVCQSPRL